MKRKFTTKGRVSTDANRQAGSPGTGGHTCTRVGLILGVVVAVVNALAPGTVGTIVAIIAGVIWGAVVAIWAFIALVFSNIGG